MQLQPPSSQMLEALKLPDLRARCKASGLTGYSKLTKAQLIARLNTLPTGYVMDVDPTSQTTDADSGNPMTGYTEEKKEGTKRRMVEKPKANRISQKKAKSQAPADDALIGSIKALAPPAEDDVARRATTPSGPRTPPEPVVPNNTQALSSRKTSAADHALSLTVSSTLEEDFSTAEPAIPRIIRPITEATAALIFPQAKLQRSVVIPSANRRVDQKRPVRLQTLTRPMVRLITKPHSSSTQSTQEQPPRSASIGIPNRVPGVSNADFLAGHFTSRILDNLRRHSVRVTKTKLAIMMASAVINQAEEMFSIALRFWVSRLHTALQMGSGESWSVAAGGHGLLSPNMAEWPVITACKRIAGDIYAIDTSDKVIYWCVAQTGDVIHRFESPDKELPRSDWAAYAASPRPLLDCIKTKSSDEFPKGIHRTFAGNGETLDLAERAALSSCVLKSFSGAASSLTAMEAEWLGIATANPDSGGSPQVNLFLPESHQILSVHLTCHPSVGIVQRHAGYSEYVLRETGQVIGNEDGIVPLWQAMLGCGEHGQARAVDAFWEGWEKRCVDN